MKSTVAPLAVPCLTCGAPRGERCRSLSKPGLPSIVTTPHTARRTAWEALMHTDRDPVGAQPPPRMERTVVTFVTFDVQGATRPELWRNARSRLDSLDPGEVGRYDLTMTIRPLLNTYGTETALWEADVHAEARW